MPANPTPMLEQYHRIKRDHRDAILMFRMGDFYEMFFEDAVEAARILEIALTARGKGTDNEAPMCGVPHHAVDSYIARLIASGRRVAVCDQVEDASKARGLVRREVVRVVTPGTVTDPASLDAKENLFIACIFPADEGAGAAYADLSTGAFRLAEARGPNVRDQLQLQMATFRPREVLLPEGCDASSLLGSGPSAGIAINTLPAWVFGRDAAARCLSEQMGTRSLAGFGCESMDLGVRAGGALLHHLRATQRSALTHIHRVLPYRAADHMVLDAPTLRTLEVVQSLAAGRTAGSLLSILDRTVTAMGARRLHAWLLRPPLQRALIEQRLDAVAELVSGSKARAELRSALKGIRDLERLLARVTLRSSNARDLLAIRESLARLPGVASLAARHTASLLSGDPGPLASQDTAAPPGSIDTLDDLRDLLDRAIEDDPPAQIHEGGMIRSGYETALDDLRAVSRDGKAYLAGLEARERQRSGIPNLKVRYNRVFGYYIEISKSNLPLVPPDYERRQTLANAERFATPELKEYEEKVLTAQERIQELEHELFDAVREQVAARAARLAAVADRIADLDVLASLAETAVSRGYRRPRITPEARTRIMGGRHPVVEALNTEERFVPNDLDLGGAEPRILIVTGPNMGGKSTYLRQAALITLMAQVGSFVPAESAEVGIVDRIFSRIGSSDNLAGGQSTFMVEMQETANILHNATERSLILLDEVGRGTSTFDGLSLAWAIVEHLHGPGQAPADGPRVLFATHYHELTELSLTMSGIRNLTVLVKESGQDVVFLRKIAEGAADRSYGIQVARLAGLPVGVIDRAREVLANLERNELGRDGLPKLARHGTPVTTRHGVSQLTLFGAPEDAALAELAEEIRKVDPDTTTPLDALAWLQRMKKRLADET